MNRYRSSGHDLLRLARLGQAGLEVGHGDRLVAQLAPAGLRDLRDGLAERQQPRAGDLVDAPGVPGLGQRGHGHVGDVVRVDERLAPRVRGQRQLAGQQRLQELGLAEVLGEPGRADHRPVGAGRGQLGLGPLRLGLAAARQQHQPPRAHPHRLARQLRPRPPARRERPGRGRTRCTRPACPPAPGPTWPGRPSRRRARRTGSRSAPPARGPGAAPPRGSRSCRCRRSRELVSVSMSCVHSPVHAVACL